MLVPAGATMDPFRRRLLTAARTACPPPSWDELAVRLALVWGVFGLLLWMGQPLAAGSGRRLSLLMLIPAMTLAACLGIKLYTDLPMAAAPLAFAGMVAALTLGRRAALAAALATAGLAFSVDLAPATTLVALCASSLLAGLVTVRRRPWTLALSGVLAGAVQGSALMLLAPPVPPFGAEAQGMELLAGLGPLFAGLAALLLAWPLLRWTEVASKGRLQRLVAPRSPLMGALRRRAPGTHRHCENVARLAAAGGRAVGADRWLLEAGAWYHDLGKLIGPELFAENHLSGEDPLASMDPRAAATRLARHVGDGLLLARRYRLPAELTALMAEHHGTASVVWPLGAEKGAAPYHHAGPLPSTKEAAVLMVCDAVEGASRRIPAAGLGSAATVVQEVVDRLMSEYQFERCGLTQAELLALSEAVTLALGRGLRQSPTRPEAYERLEQEESK